MLRLFVKDNTSGQIHEYGTNKHDALILQDDGSLHYENTQCCVGTKFPEEGYSFCFEDGTIPEWELQHGVEPYLDIAGEYYTKPQTKADRIRAMSDEELAELFGAIIREREIILLQKLREQGVEASIVEMPELTFNAHLEWLKQPAGNQ